DQGVELLGFHGRVNKPISQIEPGDFSGDIKTGAGGYFTYYNPNLKLTVGDIVHYWVFVQHKQLGYRKDDLKWTVEELRLEPGTSGCDSSKTKISDRTKVCSHTVVFEDNFESLEESKWTLEQYIPSEPDFEFVVYKKDADVTFTKSNKLCIKPKFIDNEVELKETINLSKGCTKSANSTNCVRRLYLIQNPIVSGRIVSKILFSYGEFEVKARLPSEIYLEDQHFRRILIAYSRGNAHLTGNAGDDIGSNLLFGGAISKHTEPDRSSKLSTYRSNTSLTMDSHTYKLRWTPGMYDVILMYLLFVLEQIELFIDDRNYGVVNTEPGFTDDSNMFNLVLGVGVGGISDFPDGYKSGENDKPWRNKNHKQVKTFFTSKDSWYPTWGDESRQLQIDYVKVTSI
ncbi:hypothetical protein NQ314_007118, partial [Rhamnusium bicolor]